MLEKPGGTQSRGGMGNTYALEKTTEETKLRAPQRAGVPVFGKKKKVTQGAICRKRRAPERNP